MLIVAALAFAASLGCILLPTLRGHADFADRSDVIIQVHNHWGYYLSEKREFLFESSDQEGYRLIVALLTAEICSQLQRVGIPILMMLLLGVGAAILYWRHPERLRRRQGTRPLTRTEAPLVVAEIENWANRIGMPCPILEYSSGLLQGQTFGLRGREVLMLHGSPKALEQSWGGLSQAIVLHELAHIANGDAGDREKAAAVWNASLLLMIIFLVILGCLGVFINWPFLLQVLMMLLAIHPIKSGLIRLRELYADSQAALWGASDLHCVLQTPNEMPQPWERWRWWWLMWSRWGDCTWWRAIWGACEWLMRSLKVSDRYHPSFDTRRKTLMDPVGLFGISRDLPLGVGFVITFVVASLSIFAFELILIIFEGLNLILALILLTLADSPLGSARDLMAALSGLTLFAVFPPLLTSAVLFGIAFLVAQTLGIQVQRQAVAQLVTGQPGPRSYAQLLSPAVLFALGVEGGFLMAPFSLSLIVLADNWWILFPWLIGCIALTWLWLSYTHGLARALLGSYAGVEIPRGRQRIVTWASAAFLTMTYWPLLFARVTLSVPIVLSVGGSGRLGMTLSEALLFGVLVTLVVLAFVAAALAGWISLSWLLFRSWIVRRKISCPHCQEIFSYSVTAGRDCGRCGRSLSPWLFVPETMVLTRKAG